MCIDDWNIDHRSWSKKDALLKRANIKKSNVLTQKTYNLTRLDKPGWLIGLKTSLLVVIKHLAMPWRQLLTWLVGGIILPMVTHCFI